VSAFVVRQFTIVWLVHVFEEERAPGPALAPIWLQAAAITPLWRYLASHLSGRPPRLPFVVLDMAIFFLFQARRLLGRQPGRPLPAAVAAIPTWLSLLRFLFQTVITMLCFWTDARRLHWAALADSVPVSLCLVAAPGGFPGGGGALRLLTPSRDGCPFPGPVASPVGTGGSGPVA